MPLSSLQLDIMQELINIGVGRAAGMLNQMVNTHIQLQVPVLRVLTPGQLADQYAARPIRFSPPSSCPLPASSPA